jgi:hypothetical protein
MQFKQNEWEELTDTYGICHNIVSTIFLQIPAENVQKTKELFTDFRNYSINYVQVTDTLPPQFNLSKVE